MRGAVELRSLPWVELVAAVLADAPKLDGALCATKRGHFIEAETGNRVRVDQCISICRRCPVMRACAEIAEVERDPVGVWAGVFRGTVRADDVDDESRRETNDATA
ncbi:WhiB family transcriptional regulator [Mycolicibacterium sp. 3033]|nr:WhiB family transcriptional regulator [Mycolicibacterium aurantiacum]